MILDTKWKLLDQNSEDQRYGISDGDMQANVCFIRYMYLEHDGSNSFDLSKKFQI